MGSARLWSRPPATQQPGPPPSPSAQSSPSGNSPSTLKRDFSPECETVSITLYLTPGVMAAYGLEPVCDVWAPWAARTNSQSPAPTKDLRRDRPRAGQPALQ